MDGRSGKGARWKEKQEGDRELKVTVGGGRRSGGMCEEEDDV